MSKLPSKKDFKAYEAIRKSGVFNMFDPRAREMSGLSKEKYVAVMKHYGELMEKYPDVRNK